MFVYLLFIHSSVLFCVFPCMFCVFVDISESYFVDIVLQLFLFIILLFIIPSNDLYFEVNR